MTTITEPKFGNKHTKVLALGLAVDSTENKLYYGSMAGPAISCKSLWASLCADKAKHVYVVNWHYQDCNGQAPLKHVHQTLPGSSFTHLICVSRVDNLVLAIEPAAGGLTVAAERSALLAQHMPAVLTRFTTLLNTQTTVPVLPTWSSTLWDKALTTPGAITALDSYGDCLGGWLVNLNFDWLALVSELLASRQLGLNP